MKKVYIQPITIVVDIHTESLIAISNNIHGNSENTGAYVLGEDIKETATSGEVDAVGYRSNLWND